QSGQQGRDHETFNGSDLGIERVATDIAANVLTWFRGIAFASATERIHVRRKWDWSSGVQQETAAVFAWERLGSGSSLAGSVLQTNQPEPQQGQHAEPQSTPTSSIHFWRIRSKRRNGTWPDFNLANIEARGLRGTFGWRGSSWDAVRSPCLIRGFGVGGPRSASVFSWPCGDSQRLPVFFVAPMAPNHSARHASPAPAVYRESSTHGMVRFATPSRGSRSVRLLF
ncbi:hypothetical protein FRC08_014847, partial [Ceratobasidium sp. 394]